MAVLMGNQRIDDVDAPATVWSVINTAGLNFTVPNGASTGPIRVSTVGGTSAAFGIGVTGMTASVNASGTPADATASANPGQAITL